MDHGTLQDLGGDYILDAGEDQVYGLCGSLVQVSGKVDLEVDLGDKQTFNQRFKILESDEQVLIFGKGFFDQVRVY